jgi:hypothetical protein
MEKFEYIQNSLNLKAVDLCKLTGIKFSTLRFERGSRRPIDDQLDDLVSKIKSEKFKKKVQNFIESFPQTDRVFLLSQLLNGVDNG